MSFSKEAAADIHGPSGLAGNIENDRDLFIARDGEESPGKHFQGEMFLLRIWARLLSFGEAGEFSSNPGRMLSRVDYTESYKVIKKCLTDSDALNPYGADCQEIGYWYFRTTETGDHDDFGSRSIDFGSRSVVAHPYVPGEYCFEVKGSTSSTRTLWTNFDNSAVKPYLLVGQLCRVSFDWKTLDDGGEWYCSVCNMDANGNRVDQELANIDPQSCKVIENEGELLTIRHYQIYPANGFTRVVIYFTPKIAPSHFIWMVFQKRNDSDTEEGIYLDNFAFEHVDVEDYFPSCLELSTSGLGDPYHWLDSGINQLHANLNAEVLKNTRHAGDLEITGNLIVHGYFHSINEEWRFPILQNNWREYAPEYNPPGYFKDAMGIVRLRGTVRGGNGVIFNLPPGYRPQYKEMLIVCGDGVNGCARVDIMPNGDVTLVTSVNEWLSLDGVTFRSSDIISRLIQEEWRFPALLGSWEKYNDSYNPPGYFKDSMGVIHLRGVVTNGSGNIFNLPAGYRAAYQETMTVCGDDVRTRVDIIRNGDVSLNCYRSDNRVSLDGITFSPGNTQDWQTPVCKNGWSKYDHKDYNAPGYFKDAMGIVHLKGSFDKGAANSVMFTLPEGCRPQYKKRLIVGAGANENIAELVEIDVNGDVLYVGDDWFVSLNNITFRAFDVLLS